MAIQKVLRITAKRDGFRRAGISHPATPVDHSIDSLTKQQIAALKDEPNLVVHETEVESETPKAKGAK